MDDAVVTRLYGYHGNRADDVYNATRFAERRYAVTGVDGYNRMLAGALERVDNDFPRPYGPSVDDWVDERDRAPEERRADDDYRNVGFSARATPGAAAGERTPASGIGQQARRPDGASANSPFATGGMRRGFRSGLLSGLSASVAPFPIAGRTPASPLASRHIGNIRSVVNRPASPVVTLWNPAAARRGVSNVASDAVAADCSRDANGKDEKDDINPREPRDPRDADGLAARIKADIRHHVDAELRRRLANRT